jgi:hypothetical protein
VVLLWILAGVDTQESHYRSYRIPWA